WGLNRAVKDFCNRLCDEGFVVLAPDLFGGRCPATAHEAQQALDDMDPNAAANLVLSSAVALRSASDDPSGPISVVGFSMGASLALWAAARQPESFD
ncbi:MAG: dienelactone hydrolase family protein, partial [Microthrixaceae bacterium]|nr:dienelactone hydrolase family protein [Microthrixaceae bacterium]